MSLQKKEKAWNKKILYTLCFVAISFIEIIRNCQFVEMEVPTGVIRLSEVLGGLNMQDLWYIVSNCTGLVMMVIIFSAYKLKNFCTIANGMWTALCVVVMVYLPYHNQSSGAKYHLWQVEVAVLNVWWLFIIIKHLMFRMMKEKSLKIKWTTQDILWALMTLCMVLSVNENKVWPVWYLLMFGVFYLTEYSKEDKESLYTGMIDGSILSFCIVQIEAFFLRPYDELRYTGIHYNSNMAGLYYLTIYMMCLYKLHLLQIKKEKRGKKVFYLLLAGVTLSLQFMTMCRTAWICSVVVTIFYGIFVMRKIWEQQFHQILLRGVFLVFSMALTFVPVFMAARWLSTTLPIRVWYGGEWGSKTKITMSDAADSEKYTEIDELLNEVFGRLQIGGFLSKIENPFVLKAYAQEIEETYDRVELVEPDWITDQGLRERISIYKAYWDDLTLVGNSSESGFYYLGEGNYHSWHAQNLWLQIAYYYGVPAGIMLILLTLTLLVYGYRLMMKNKENPYAIIPFFMSIVFFGFGTMEVVWNLGQMILFLIFFVQKPLGNIQLVEEKSLESEKNN